MRIKQEEKTTYSFYNPCDTNSILYEVIKKEGKYEFNRKKGKEERKDWWYSISNLSINLNLVFGRLLPYSEERDNKDKYLNLVIKEMEKINNEKIQEKILQRFDENIKKICEAGSKYNKFSTILCWRMVIGLGASHPQETSMTLHHIYGIPYIPGSAIKGVTRHWVILKEFDKLNLPIKQINCFVKILESADIGDKDKSKRECEEKFKTKSKDETIIPDEKLYNFLKNNWKEIELFQNIFGTQQQQGKVIFFDAYPVDKIELKMDVMTPHYGPYYSDTSGKTPPADYHNPNPIKFLTVEKTMFQFYLASKSSDLLQIAEEWLKDALQNFGIGAKTSMGYGYFELGVNNNENTCF